MPCGEGCGAGECRRNSISQLSGLINAELKTRLEAFIDKYEASLSSSEIQFLAIDDQYAAARMALTETHSWDQAIGAAIDECYRLEHYGKDNHLTSWMENAAAALRKLFSTTQD